MTVSSRVSAFLSSLKVELVEIRGTCKQTGLSASIVCSVGEKTKHYLAELLFKPGYQFNVIGSTWLWNMAAFAGGSGSDAGVFFLETARNNKKLRFYGDQYFRIPVWIRGQVDLPLNEKATKKKDFREQARKIRKAGYRYEVTRSLEQFEVFYRNMYMPQVSRSHGESKLIATREKLRNYSDNFELLMVKDGEQFIAGELISYVEAVPELRAIGVRDSNTELLRKGALSACYYFAFEYLEQQGFSRVSLGDSRGFIDDGVLTFKRKWGQVLVEAKSLLLLMRIVRDTPETRGLLSSLSIICENGGELESIVFLDAAEISTARASEKFVQRHHVPGTSSLLACVIEENMSYSSSSLVRLDA